MDNGYMIRTLVAIGCDTFTSMVEEISSFESFQGVFANGTKEDQLNLLQCLNKILEKDWLACQGNKKGQSDMATLYRTFAIHHMADFWTEKAAGTNPYFTVEAWQNAKQN